MIPESVFYILNSLSAAAASAVAAVAHACTCAQGQDACGVRRAEAIAEACVITIGKTIGITSPVIGIRPVIVMVAATAASTPVIPVIPVIPVVPVITSIAAHMIDLL